MLYSLGGGLIYFLFLFPPRTLGKMNPIWLSHIFSKGLPRSPGDIDSKSQGHFVAVVKTPVAPSTSVIVDAKIAEVPTFCGWQAIGSVKLSEMSFPKSEARNFKASQCQMFESVHILTDFQCSQGILWELLSLERTQLWPSHLPVVLWSLNFTPQIKGCILVDFNGISSHWFIQFRFKATSLMSVPILCPLFYVLIIAFFHLMTS